MSAKRVVSAALLAFVAVSVLFLVRGESGRAPAGATESAPASGAAIADTEGEEGCTDGMDAQVVAYYFHGTARCRTCRAIEDGARAVLTRELATAFESGAIQWRTVDFEEPENEHFAKDFELNGATLVLVKEIQGQPEKWDKLERVWELVGDDAQFDAYVLGQAKGYLNES